MRWTTVFMISEALLGAKLVLFGLVNLDQSGWRVVVMSLHQLNSFLLVAFTVRLLGATYEHQYRTDWSRRVTTNPQPRFLSSRVFLMGFLLIAVTGAWASLSTTLFPSTSLLDGLTKDFESGSHVILKLRGFHPVFGILIGGTLSLALYRISSQLNVFLARVALVGSALIATGIIVGMLTLFMLSPVPLKLVHLLIAHLLWSTAVFFYHFHSIPERTI
jgi:heme a synthase